MSTATVSPDSGELPEEPDTPPTAPTAGPAAPVRDWHRALLTGAAGVAAAWLVPALTHLVGADWLLPPLIWVFLASLLRSGRCLLDRLVLALVMLVAATSAAGLVISLWPWGLHPVPIAGCALTVLVTAAVTLRRRPQLPPPRASDLAAVGGGLLATAVLVIPYLGADFTDRISMVILGEDMARHFSLYDAIGLTGHYAFFARGETEPYLLSGMQTYPQLSHFLYAMLDSFLRGGAPPPDALTSFDHYVGYHIAGYAFFAVLVFWAARWVAPRHLHGWPKTAVYAFVVAAVVFSELVAMVMRGYPGEIMGLAMLAVLVALVARPPRRTRELIVTIGALVVGISWTYFFLLPFAGAVAIAALVAYRRRVMACWVTTLAAAIPTIPLGLAPFLIMYSDRVSPLADLLPRGPAEGVNRPLTVGIAVLLLAGLATAPRSPVWRMMSVQLVIVATISILLGVFQIISIGHLSYYFDKAVHALFVVCLVGLSGVTPLLARVRRSGQGRLRELTVHVLVVIGIFSAFGAVPLQRPSIGDDLEPIRNVSWGMAHAAGNLENRRHARIIAEVLHRYPTSDGRLTQVIGPGNQSSYVSTLFVSVLYRNYGAMAHAPVSATPLYTFKKIDVKVYDYPLPRRIIVINNEDRYAQLEAVLATRPDLDVDLVFIELDID